MANSPHVPKTELHTAQQLRTQPELLPSSQVPRDLEVPVRRGERIDSVDWYVPPRVTVKKIKLNKRDPLPKIIFLVVTVSWVGGHSQIVGTCTKTSRSTAN